MTLDPTSNSAWEAVHPAESCRPLRVMTLPRREVRFPLGRSVGTLSVRGPGPRWSGRARHGWSAGWRELGEARGRVTVPAGNQLKLRGGRAGTPDPAALECLAPGDLQALSLHGDAGSEEIVAALGHLAGLEALELWTAPVGDDIIPMVSSLPGLRVLDLWGTHVTDAGLQTLLPHRGLRHLTVPIRTGDASMVRLAEIKGLRELNLAGSSVTDAGLELLARAQSLVRLSLWGTRISDAGLRHLRGLRSLAVLDLGATAITDQALADLARLRLRRLSLHDALVTPVGLGELRDAMPGCRVDPVGAGALAGCQAWRPPPAASQSPKPKAS